MKILFYEYKEFPTSEYEQILMDLGHEVKVITNTEKFTSVLSDDFKALFAKTISDFSPDFVFSMDFFSSISDLCESRNIKYVGWVVDNPFLELYSKSLFNKCNYIFIFDESQYNEFKAKGIDHIYYLPLSVNTNRLDNIIINPSDIEQYESEVSFVGRLYNNNRYDHIKALPAYVRGFVDGLIMTQLKVTGFNLIERSLTSYFVDQFRKYGAYSIDESIDISEEKLIAHEFIGKKCTQIDRIRTLNSISDICVLTVFSDDNLESLTGIKAKPFVQYIDQMPKVFKLSKINLNITAKGIVTGIPLRVFDVMGAKGFLLTNYQFELEKYFELGKDIVVYYNIEDLKEKIQYYLEHDQERLEIAHNGYMKVKKYHLMSDKLNFIVNTVTGKN